MVLPDTTVWVEHLRRGDDALARLIADGAVLAHRFVLEELACGSIPERKSFIDAFGRLEKAPEASHAEFLHFIDSARLDGKGLGMVDVHLLASARLARARLWTRDAALRRAAAALGVLHDVP